MKLIDKEKAVHLFLCLALVVTILTGMSFQPVYVVTVDGQEVIAFETEEEANTVLENVLNGYDAKDVEYTTNTFREDVDVILAYSEAELTNNLEYAEKLLKNAYLTVKTVGYVTETKAIDYDVAYEQTDALQAGEEKVKTEGIPGEKAIVYQVEMQNGIEIAAVQASEAVIAQPRDEVILVGSRDIPTLESLFLQNPVRGSLTSHFGERWNRQHCGIDIGAPAGTPITAAEGGTVIYSEYNTGGYGNLVKLSHGNGIETWYAHCSALLVSEGDVVEQGEEIGLVGTTGNSTGNHLHFEVRVSGEPVDPLFYVSY